MAKFRALDVDNDWQFGAGLNNYASNNDAVALDIKTRLAEWLGDCFFATDRGIDWLNRLGKTNQRTPLENDIKTIILQTNGVTKLNSFTTTLAGRVFTATYDVQTIYSKSYISFVEMNI